MFARSPKILLAGIAIGILSLGADAQLQQEQLTKEAEELRNVIDYSIKTSTFENGKLTSFRVRTPNDIEKVISVVQGDDKRSFTMFDQGRATKVAVEEDGRLSSMVFPNGKRLDFEWVMMSNGYWVPRSIKVDGKNIATSNIEEGGDCYNVCRQAAAAAAIAIGVCYASGGLAPACWSATATAAYLAYVCYECTYPQNELARKNELILVRPYLCEELWTRKG
jgi:hypothetical protein